MTLGQNDSEKAARLRVETAVIDKALKLIATEFEAAPALSQTPSSLGCVIVATGAL
jgi:hypothetical protein